MIIQNIYKFNKIYNIFFFKKKCLLYISGFFGVLFIKLSINYFINKNKKNINFIFLNKIDYKNLIKNFINSYNNISKLYCVKLKIRGLGYRIRKVTNNLYYFFFNYTNMFYFNIPNNILIKWYKKKIIFLSNNNFKLKLLFSHILLLKKIGPYRLHGFRYPKQIILLKKKIKKL